MSNCALHALVDHICDGERPWQMTVALAVGKTGARLIFTLPDKLAVLTFDEADLLAQALVHCCATATDNSTARELFLAGQKIAGAVAIARAETSGGSVH